MQTRSIRKGRPLGAKTFETLPARAFGESVRAARTEEGIAQEALAHLAGIERSHLGKIERGEHMPTLALIFRIARALDRSAGELVLETEARLQQVPSATPGTRGSAIRPLRSRPPTTGHR
jgi:transcriptional regulator with XRE-family HTH domain